MCLRDIRRTEDPPTEANLVAPLPSAHAFTSIQSASSRVQLEFSTVKGTMPAGGGWAGGGGATCPAEEVAGGAVLGLLAVVVVG